jgi:lipoprotein NlpI
MAFLLATTPDTRSRAQLPPETRNCVALAARDPEQAVQLCTDVIRSGHLSDQYLPLVLKSRGDAFFNLQEYDLAIQDYDRVFKMNVVDADLFNNRGAAYMLKGYLERSIEDFTSAIKLNPKRAWYQYNRGRAQFFLGRYGLAHGDFADAQQREPKIPDLAIWLYIDDARNGLDARSELQKNAARISRKDWPGIIIDFYLGKAAPEQILSAAKSRNNKKEKEQLCEAYFYLAERALIAGNRDDALVLLHKSLQVADTDSEKAFPASAELRYLENH